MKFKLLAKVASPSRKTAPKDYNFAERRAHMSLHKPCLFAITATLAGSASVGVLNVQIQEYDVPTPKSRPHDPALAPDGSLWYTGQAANKLGRLDPKTGEFKEYPLKTPNSGPHGLVSDKRISGTFRSIRGEAAERMVVARRIGVRAVWHRHHQ
jgi:streptogramin lyase